MRQKMALKAMAVLAAGFICLAGCGADGKGQAKLDPKHPTTVTVWHYYNSTQQKAFDALVSEFNDTVGREKGVVVESYSQGNVGDLENSVLEAVHQKAGASEIPNIFAAYADTAYEVDRMGLAADLSQYLTEEEQGRFIKGYLEEGRFEENGGIKIFPVAKSVEIFMLNQTDWEVFAQATGARKEDLSTMEGVTATAQKYYEWTDSLTEEPEDGKAFFGRDAMANYFLIGARQMGVELFSVQNGQAEFHLDREVMRRLWDNYYVPFVKGYFSAIGRFRSDDIKTGNIICFVGSSSGANFFPTEVTVNDEESYPIEMAVLPCPQFEGGERFAVQQGAGMVVTNLDPQEVLASVEFLKWFTEDEQNIQFSVSSGYLPVTKTANDLDAIRRNMGEQNVTASILEAALETVTQNTLYTPKAFEEGTSARSILEYSLSDKAAADRAVVKERIDEGMSLEEAAAEFLAEENFEGWFKEIEQKLGALA